MERPKNVFDIINENIVTVSEDLHAMMRRFDAMEQEVIALSMMFRTPEQPNARGEEGDDGVSSEHEIE